MREHWQTFHRRCPLIHELRQTGGSGGSLPATHGGGPKFCKWLPISHWRRPRRCRILDDPSAEFDQYRSESAQVGGSLGRSAEVFAFDAPTQPLR